MTNFRVLQIDHVEIFVPDRVTAAEWYANVLGLEIVEEHRSWAEGPGGPMMIACADGATMLALFQGPPQGSAEPTGIKRVAFRVTADGFIEFLRRLDDQPLNDHLDGLLTRDSVVDHDQSFSVYFCDPYGNQLEVTTYEYDETRHLMATSRTDEGS